MVNVQWAQKQKDNERKLNNREANAWSVICFCHPRNFMQAENFETLIGIVLSSLLFIMVGLCIPIVAHGKFPQFALLQMMKPLDSFNLSLTLV